MGLFSGICSCLEGRLKGRGGAGDDEGSAADDGDTCDLFFELRALQVATNFFSDFNRLGHGGFGPVYKGLMPNGMQIAVKKLSLYSRQGVREFTNEVKLLLRIQHKNLVTLLGCCIDGPEKMLVYEYLPNKSLDCFLFDKTKSASLDWATRFRIIFGVARGLLYLHEEAPERIIHRDIKASNILLDEKLNPKISDFGLARLFPGDETHVNTFRISGTQCIQFRGFGIGDCEWKKESQFTPECRNDGPLDLCKFCWHHLNPITTAGVKAGFGKRLTSTWKLYQGGKALELVDPSLAKCNPDEAAMCIQLGLLCCQATVQDRPDMNSVHLMLSSDSFTLPRPGKPGILGRTGRWTTASSAFTNTNATSTSTGITKASGGSSFVEEYSRNSISISSLDEGR